MIRSTQIVFEIQSLNLNFRMDYFAKKLLILNRRFVSFQDFLV